MTDQPTAAPQPTSTADLRAGHAAAERFIQEQAALAANKASVLPAGVEPATRTDVETFPDTRAMSVKDASLARHAYEADIADVLAGERRARGESAAPANAGFVAELQQVRQAMGAKPSSLALKVWETQLQAAARGFNGHIDSIPAFFQRNGQPLSPEQIAQWQADVQTVKREIAAGSVSAQSRAAGYVSSAELDTSGYVLPAGNEWQPETAQYLAACKSAGVSQGQITAILTALASGK